MKAFDLKLLRARLLTRWEAMPAGERKRVPMVSALLLLGAFAVFHAFVTMPRLYKAETDLNRLRGRAEQMRASAKKPAAPRRSARSPAALARDLAEIEASLAREDKRLQALRMRFADLGNLAEHQQLRLGLSDLANNSDIEVIRIETLGIRREEQARAPTVERLLTTAEHNPSKRPLLRLQARASYRGLMQFLDGLSGLPHVASPVKVKVEVKTDATEDTAATRQWLEVDLELAL